MEAKFQQGQKILYGYYGDKKGKVDFIHDLGKDGFRYSITLNEELQEITTQDLTSGRQTQKVWKVLSKPETQDKVMEHNLKAA